MAGEKKRNPSIDNAFIHWKERDFKDIVNFYGLASEWEPEYPAEGSTADKPPAKKMAVYTDHFTTGNLQLSITKFVEAVLTAYGATCQRSILSKC